jgi:hypothetical protein
VQLRVFCEKKSYGDKDTGERKPFDRDKKPFYKKRDDEGGDEKKWAAAYVAARRKWLSEFQNPIVQKTVYRMDTFNKIIQDDNWELDKPFMVLGVKL